MVWEEKHIHLFYNIVFLSLRLFQKLEKKGRKKESHKLQGDYVHLLLLKEIKLVLQRQVGTSEHDKVAIGLA